MLALRVLITLPALFVSIRAAADDLPFADKLRLVREEESRRVAVLERAARSVVCIFADRNKGGGGSGVIIGEDGLGLTNYHVVAGFLKTREGVGGLSDGRLYPLHVLGIDPGGDIAMFKLSGRQRFDAAPLGDSDAVAIGDPAAAMGNPFGLAEDTTPTVTWGIVSGVHRYQSGQGNALEYADCIQVSSSINPGNSGGPLFNMAGEIIGINGRGSFEERGRVNVGLGYAVSVNQIKRFLPGLRAGQVCEHGTLGATVMLAGRELIFDAIQDVSPVDLAGVKLGDRLVSLAGREIHTPNAFLNVLTTLPAGWPTTLGVLRDGRRVEFGARLERMIVPMQQKYDLDWKHNHAELRRLIAPLRIGGEPAAGGGESKPVGGITWTGRVGIESDSADIPVRVTQHADGHIVIDVQDSDRRIELHVGDSASSAQPASDSADSMWADRRVWDEWHNLTSPLMLGEKVTLGWELLGGDEVAGRIATVIERRFASGRRFRWKIDYQTERLAAMTAGDATRSEASVWTPIGDADEPPSGTTGRTATVRERKRLFDAWPARWRRTSPDGPQVVIALDQVGLAPASQPASGSAEGRTVTGTLVNVAKRGRGMQPGGDMLRAGGMQRRGAMPKRSAGMPPRGRSGDCSAKRPCRLTARRRHAGATLRHGTHGTGSVLVLVLFAFGRPAFSVAMPTASSSVQSAANQVNPVVEANQSSPVAAAIECVLPRVVKIYGATIGREHGFGSGVIVSADGSVVTALSILLEGRNVRVVLNDGRQFDAQVTRRDESRQLALLKIDAGQLPFFELVSPDSLKPGDWLVAAGNSFKVAEADEPVSVWTGVLAGRTNLAARRRTQAYPYSGPVLLVDMIVSTPGMAGGAIADLDGRLVGLIGNPVVSELTGTWINYAMPVEEVAAFVRGDESLAARPADGGAAQSGDAGGNAGDGRGAEGAGERGDADSTGGRAADGAADGRAGTAGKLDLGIRLFEIGGRSKPAYVERVRPDGPARAAGVRRDDLVVAINGRLVATCDDFHAIVAGLKAGEPIDLVVKRKDELVTLRVTPGGK